MMTLGLTLMLHLFYYATAPPTPPSPLDPPAQAAAITAEGVELFAMAKAIPRLQRLDGASLT